jgi:signal transduction histidine kinase/DNA-binding LacI/PurR family transcriptional regulator/AraC-like DNA-binding protein
LYTNRYNKNVFHVKIFSPAVKNEIFMGAFPNHTPTIGMLTASLSGPTENALWQGVADQVNRRNINLICFSGGIPHWQWQFEDQKNLLFQFAGRQNVSGLLIWANILSHSLDRSGLEEFCRRYKPLPIISVGMFLPSIPSIRIDMQEGMSQLLSHLIEVHGRRRIAFIKGLEVSQDAEDRYHAYLETIEQYGLTYDPDLVLPGNFRRDSAVEAVHDLVDQKHKEFDTLVSANDNMAIGAMKALQRCGIRVPEDVIVAGFDNIEETRSVTPTLTTVRAPWNHLGRQSVDLILAKLAGEPLPEQVLLKTELVCRQSCGCESLAAERFPESDFIHQPNVDVNEWVSVFLADVAEGAEKPSRFIQHLVDTIANLPSGSEILDWQASLEAVSSAVEPLLFSEPEISHAQELLRRGTVVIGETAHRQELRHHLEERSQTELLNRIVQTMATIYDIDTLMKLLAQELPGLGIHSCFLSLYEAPGSNPEWSRLILACSGKLCLPLSPGGIRFPTAQLVPSGFLPKDRNFSYDIEALYFQKEQIGFALFEIGPREGEVYTTLRGHISSALKNAGLMQSAIRAEEIAVKADHLKTRLLANVSHELRAPINIILGLSQLALSHPNPYGIELPERLAKDLEYISESGEQLVRLVNDLLDLSRAEIGELDLCFESVQPRSLLMDIYESWKKISISKQKKVEIILDVPDHLPFLHADPDRLRQILMNLLSNALKFTQKGKIILGADVQLPHLHIWVSDTGSGIPLEIQERIFEPFVKGESMGQRMGGIGLGLTITRRLVALHGGSITLDSQPEEGSTFHVYIPLPGLATTLAKEVIQKNACPALLWISSQKHLPAEVQNICQKNGFTVIWLRQVADLEPVIQHGNAIALAWDLGHARPGDWAIIQKLRAQAYYCQLPVLLYQEYIGLQAAGSRMTNVMMKPAGRQAITHILDLLPQAMDHGEIWVVDDDAQARKYYHDLLSEALSNFVVREVNGGKEALKLLLKSTPVLVLLDLMMPEVDGFQVLENLRGSTKTAVIPVIVLTGKMLSYEDIKRLDYPKITLQTKGILSDHESIAETQRALENDAPIPQQTSLLIKQTIAYIQQNYTRSFTLKELADTIGISRNYLSRIFKQDTGISLWDYINRYRICKASELLLLSNESITEIAAQVGYEDGGYFSRVFREITGCSPRAYKHQRSLPTTSIG